MGGALLRLLAAVSVLPSEEGIAEVALVEEVVGPEGGAGVVVGVATGPRPVWGNPSPASAGWRAIAALEGAAVDVGVVDEAWKLRVLPLQV